MEFCYFFHLGDNLSCRKTKNIENVEELLYQTRRFNLVQPKFV